MEHPGRLLLGLLVASALFVAVGVLHFTRPTGRATPPKPREACVSCHSAELGDPVHGPLAIACTACHAGDPTASNPQLAHAGLVGFPGNLDAVDRTCGTCHAESVAHVRASLMATGAGMVAVNRFAFGEQPLPDGHVPLAQLADSPADSHLKQLCVECHLGFPRTKRVPLGPGVRGGGCSACHLQHDPATKHPAMTAKVPDSACFSCHSGSGRISLSYAGWHETTLGADEAAAHHKVVAEGRVLEPHPADVHHERGLACIDCHTLRDVMGDGKTYAHEEQAVEVRCDDCHRATPPATVTADALDPASAGLVRRNPHLARPGALHVVGARGRAFTNVTWEDGKVVVTSKSDGRTFAPKPPDAKCAAPEHRRLDCRACHTEWAPSCLGCHTERDAGGPWRESAGSFLADAPALGVLGDRIVPVAPGMVMTVADAGKTKAIRLFSPVAPHTVGSKVRSCASCHRDPAALGMGRRTADGTPAYAPLDDGLPADAWLGEQLSRGSTRTDLRPFDAAERARILGAAIPE